ncbi:MAG: CoB--CoM heterodisulfide reductase iron-sulfur subunit A family protein [bacterium]|nr:MAG: CoB--CoM heterodisulfide reductase iron-sulfur subunit A family protein [bacterium]
MMDVGRHPHIKLFTHTEVLEVTGKAGNFKVKILHRARFVDENECTACGDCAEVCPVVAPNEFDEGLGLRRAIYSPFSQAVPSAYIRSDMDCLGTNPIACGKCVEVCQKKCVNLDMPDKIEVLEVGAIIVATGIDYYDPREASEYGYTRFQNVVNSIELERLLSPSGPSGGKLVRFTDQKPPKRVSFIQCVGSRCIRRDIPYCSRICCMNAVKSALLIREMYPDAQIDIFYIDIRAFGKGFEQFYQRALQEGNINFVRGKPSRLEEDPKTGDLIILSENVETGKTERLRTSMVILSEAVVPAANSHELAKVLGARTDARGFFLPKDACGDPITSTNEGIYLCGCSTGPKDITDSIAEASGAAVRAAQYLSPYKLPEVKEEIPDYDISGPLRVGVFVCHCGSNIAGVLDVDMLKIYAASLPDVVFSDNLLFACAESTQRLIQEKILENKLNRVVVAACTPRTHEPIFRETLRKVGLNPYLLEMANIRDQCSWVHGMNPVSASAKAKDLIRMAVAKARNLEPLEQQEMEIGHNVMVIGGGISGLETAIQLAKRDYTVYLVEKSKQVGGWVKELRILYPSGMSGQELIDTKLKEINKEKIKIFTEAAIENISGFVGNFEVTLRAANGKPAPETLQVGAIVIATGFELYGPSKGEFGYQKYPNIITNMELEYLLKPQDKFIFQNKPLKHVSFIQCVGSRGPDGLPECSRYCCQAAIKQAIALQKMGIQATVFNRDIRVYHHEAETMYREARKLGVTFIRYTPENPPKLVGDKQLKALQFREPVLKKDIEVPTDLLVLSVGMRPSRKSIAEIQRFIKVPLGMDGFVLEKHPKFGPVETNIEGVFICGCIQGPKDISDSIGQANAVAAKVDALLARSTILMEPITSVINEELCRGCGTCVDVCEFGAISLQEKEGAQVALVNEALCKGCGTCATYCPTGAIDIRHFRDQQIESMLKAFLLEEDRV